MGNDRTANNGSVPRCPVDCQPSLQMLAAQPAQPSLASANVDAAGPQPANLCSQHPDFALELVLVFDQLLAVGEPSLAPYCHGSIVGTMIRGGRGGCVTYTLPATDARLQGRPQEDCVFQVDSTTSEPCSGDNDFICDWIYDVTGNERVADAADWFVERPLTVLLIWVVAYIVNRLARSAIARGEERMIRDREKRLAERQAEEVEDGRFEDMEMRARETSIELNLATEQAKQRARTLGSVMRSAASVVIFALAVLMSLAEFNVNLGPLIAGAGIAGVALGFGAQSIVRDFLSGFFMLVEDQFSVGDVIDVGEATGVVEGIGLRTTQLRDVNGTLWYFPNGEIHRVANKSQQWARAVLDIEVAYDTDIEKASRVIKEVADQVWHEHVPSATIIEEPEVWGVEMFGESSVAIRLVCKVEPGEQWSTNRVIRRRVKEAFDREGIEIPFPQRVIWTKQAEPAETE